MIRFYCANCEQKIKASDDYAGKKGECPKCKNAVVIPQLDNVPSPSLQNDKMVSFGCSMCPAQLQAPESSRGQIIACKECGCYAEVPLEAKKEEPALSGGGNIQLEQPTLPDNSEYGSNSAVAEIMNSRARKTGAIGRRKLPIFIDVILYPLNVPGLTMLGIFVFTPLFFFLISFLLLSLGPLGMILLAPLAIAFGLINWVVRLYTFWYFAECI